MFPVREIWDREQLKLWSLSLGFFFFSSRRRHTRLQGDWSSDVCSSDLFEHSPTPLTDWFYAIYLMTATRNGVSAKELQRQLGVTYKCAWRIGHQLRDLMAARAKTQHPGPLSGHVEVDEAYIGGKLKGRRGKGAYLKNKTIVLGMVERKGAFRGKIIPDERQASVFPV